VKVANFKHSDSSFTVSPIRSSNPTRNHFWQGDDLVPFTLLLATSLSLGLGNPFGATPEACHIVGLAPLGLQ